MSAKNEVSARFIEAYETLLRDNKVSDKRSFAAKLGISASMVTEISKGRSSVGTSAIQNIVLQFNIDPKWLLTGEGEMLNISPQCKKTCTNPTKQDDNKDKSPSVSYNSVIGKPYYDVDFLGGFNEIVNSQVTIPTNNIVIQGFEKADFWCNVTGHSMEPKINHGDIIALHKCTLEDIQYGEIYAVVLDTLRTIKILRRSSDPKKLRFAPINTTDYDEQEYPVERIMNVFEVIGSISKFF